MQIQPITDDLFENVIRAALAAFASEVNPILDIGISGSRNRPVNPQLSRFAGLLGRIAKDYPGPVRIHHGCCTGIDELAHETGRMIPGCELYGYPGTDARGNSPHRAELTGFTRLYPPAQYGERNRRLIDASKVVITAPQYPEADTRSLRSGTWQTIRYARKTRKPVLCVMADG